MYVYEEEPENLARHILLLSVLLDGTLLAKERTEIFLELHGNALVRPRTAEYLGGSGSTPQTLEGPRGQHIKGGHSI
jgi:dynein assembly factor 3